MDKIKYLCRRYDYPKVLLNAENMMNEQLIF